MKALEVVTALRYGVGASSVWELGHALRPVNHELAAIVCFVVAPLMIAAMAYKLGRKAR